MQYFITTTNPEALEHSPIVWTIEPTDKPGIYDIHADKDQTETLARLPGVSEVVPGKLDTIVTLEIPEEALERAKLLSKEMLKKLGILRLVFPKNQD